ncbi:hypothetical protein QEZ40_006386 [Streptomyces katrae]|uniref:Transposase n=1 Tax=Streptomyces katrae TaxID=68223 RepID=A0ABT7H3T3_9ACTN|nr:hypothetical protein [Streptomyces katrae]MDK9500561.1 hypothetical protein [Streptomyces katrae]
MDLPEQFGSWKGVQNRLRVWAADGTWAKVFTALLAQADAEGDLDWVVAVDSTIARAHRHAAGPPLSFSRLARLVMLPHRASHISLLRVPRRIGRPRVTLDVVLADKAYSSRAIRRRPRRRGIRAVIPQPAD